MKKKVYYTVSIIATIFLFVSCRSGEYKEENGKLYHFYYPGGGSTHKEEVKGADLKTFQQITEYYGKDKKNVYRYSDSISNADPSSFQILDEPQYSKDKNYVFLKRKTIPSADPETFEYIYNNFSKDKNNVFYSNKLIPKADPVTFEKITHFMWKDKNNVFYYDSILPNADPKTMKKVVGYDCWLTDKNAVYYFDNRINVAPKDFEIIYYNWGRSKTNYYFRHIRLPLDYTTAEILMEEGKPTKATRYIKDKNNVFYEDKKIEGADPKTFVLKDFWSAYDANHEYRGAEIKE